MEPSDPPAAALTVEDVWRDFAGPLHGFVHRRVADRHAVDDIVSDVMLRIHTHIDGLDDHEKVTAWVFRIARNAITDHYRRTARRPDAPSALTDDTPAAGPTPTGGSTTRASWLATCRSCCDPSSTSSRRTGEPRAHRPRRHDPGRRRPPRARLGLGHEVTGAARPPPAHRAPPPALRDHPRRHRHAGELHPTRADGCGCNLEADA